jgi:hypothetical protein
VAETDNIAQIAMTISKDIFRVFKWFSHPKKNENFTCVCDRHQSLKAKKKKTHPGDVVFMYEDPYLQKDIYLHSDLKSYSKDSITKEAVRSALRSLAMTIECAGLSEDWRSKYSADKNHEVRGLLFVHNHDHKYQGLFSELLSQIDVATLPIAHNNVIHILTPADIQRVYSIAHDIISLKGHGNLTEDYTFYYPDLVLRRRQGDVWNKAATIESLTGPFLILKHKGDANQQNPGFVVYYNRRGGTPEEFEYLIDCMSRFQLLESGQSLRVRCVAPDTADDAKSFFDIAVKRYARAWGFSLEREQLLEKIEVDRIPTYVSNYNPGDMGWRK